MDQNLITPHFTEKELEGIQETRTKIKEYLGSESGSKGVRQFLSRVQEDDIFLYRFLKGPKFRSKHAWETIKRYAEVRFDSYPECFPSTFPEATIRLWDNCTIGILKARDSKGRRIAFFNTNDWDIDRHTLELLATTAVQIAEQLLLDEDCVNNGLVFIQECSGMGMKHARQHTLQELLRFLNVFWYSFPLKMKGIFYINLPYLLSFLYGIIKPFFPNKLKERFVLTSTGKGFEALHERISPDILPKCLGGNLENHEACDLNFVQF